MIIIIFFMKLRGPRAPMDTDECTGTRTPHRRAHHGPAQSLAFDEIIVETLRQRFTHRTAFLHDELKSHLKLQNDTDIQGRTHIVPNYGYRLLLNTDDRHTRGRTRSIITPTT